MLVYLAAPIDAVYDGSERTSMRREAKDALHAAGFATFDPSAPFGAPGNGALGVVRVNDAALAESDAVLALLPRGVPSIGVPMEIQKAQQLGRPVAVVGGEGSIQLAGMDVSQFETVDDAVEWIRKKTRFPGVVQKLRGLAAATELPVEPMELKWTGDELCAPFRSYSGDAGFDLIVSRRTRIPYRGFEDVPLGISVELPPGVWAMLTGRSSTLRTRKLLVTQGIIDNGYRGELFAGVQNMGREAAVVERGDRIAQLIPLSLESSAMEAYQVTELSESDRGVKGFGSTGT